MIARIAGEVVSATLRDAVIDVSGLGVRVLANPTTLAALRVGEWCVVHTSLIVREDSLTLFGFGQADERDAFELVQSVTGVGPKLALAMLSVFTPAQLAATIQAGDEKALTRIPGVGAKSAARLVLELTGKVDSFADAAVSTPAPAASAALDKDVLDALVGLGWPAKSAEAALAKAAGAAPSADTPGLLRAALRILGGGR